MNKKIKLILKKDYNNLGKKNHIIQVNRGYGLNYLLPNGICEIITKKQVKHLNMLQKIQDKKIEKNKSFSLLSLKKLKLIKKIFINKKVGENYNLFGKINDKDIIKKVNFYSNSKIEKRQININDSKKAGILSAEIKLPYCENINFNIYIYPVNI
uniref:50S ribosomal protein L9, chloroplastic n=1 Tax=Taenioma perpusillum TaxID=210852 RepID=A0A1Z1MSA1_9FLOR|nr:ribosomal protein L9 [Taenioma perpusillum]ARW68584.1 ribosomal protein L9 [Taenioma perpusillum]